MFYLRGSQQKGPQFHLQTRAISFWLAPSPYSAMCSAATLPKACAKNGAGHGSSCSPRSFHPPEEPKNEGLENYIPFRLGDFSGSILIFLGNMEAQETYQASMKNKCILLWWVPAAPSKSQRLGLRQLCVHGWKALSSAALEANFQHLLPGMVWLLLWLPGAPQSELGRNRRPGRTDLSIHPGSLIMFEISQTLRHVRFFWKHFRELLWLLLFGF